jgi:hypothetical protein
MRCEGQGKISLALLALGSEWLGSRRSVICVRGRTGSFSSDVIFFLVNDAIKYPESGKNKAFMRFSA